jgi:hypothetical protein
MREGVLRVDRQGGAQGRKDSAFSAINAPVGGEMSRTSFYGGSGAMSREMQPPKGNASKEMKTEFAEMSSDALLDAVKEKLLNAPFAEPASRPAASLAIVEKLSQEERDRLAFMMVSVMIEPEQGQKTQREQEEALKCLEETREVAPPAAPPVSQEDTVSDRAPAVDSPGLASKTIQETAQPSLSANNLDPPTREPVVHERPQPSSKSLADAPDRARNEELPDSEITLVSQHRSGSGHENAINFKQRDGGFDSLAAGTFDNGQSASGAQAFSVGQGMGLKAGEVASSMTMAHVAETGSPDEIAIRYRIKHAPQAPPSDAHAGATQAASVQSSAPPPPTGEQATAMPLPTASPPRYDQAIAASPIRGSEAPAQQQNLPSSVEKSARPQRGVLKSNVAQIKPGLLYRLLHPAGLRVSGFVRHSAIESHAPPSPVQLSAKKESLSLTAGAIKDGLSNGRTRREMLKEFTQERGIPFPERSRTRGSPGHGM